jgi:hypothetical protein
MCIGRLAIVLGYICALGGLWGCSSGDKPMNPSLAITVADARAELTRMRESPLPPVRPVVVIGGLFDVGLAVSDVRSRLASHFPEGSPIISVGLFGLGTQDGCRDRVLREVEEAFGRGESGWTVEVDVIGFSLGGIVARHSALPREDGGTRLRIARLFTLAAPHMGTGAAELPTLDQLVVDIRPRSAELARLDAALPEAGYEILPYVRLGDEIVGAENAAPPGETAWWVANLPLQWAHGEVYKDPRIMADIVRRLRGEEPIATEPRSALPE